RVVDPQFVSNGPQPPPIYPLSLHDALPISLDRTLRQRYDRLRSVRPGALVVVPLRGDACGACYTAVPRNRRTQIRSGDLLDACEDRKSTRLNSSHDQISYAVFCLKKKNKKT